MQRNIINTVEKLLLTNGFKVLDNITIDSFGRFHGVLTDKSKNKYFLKAVSTNNIYSFRSLKAEISLNYLLSEITENSDVSFENKRLIIPKVNKVLESENLLCMISDYAEGKKLIDETSEIQLRYLNFAIKLIEILTKKVNMTKITQNHKNYSKSSLLINSPFKLFKAIIITPKLTTKLLSSYLRVLPVFKYNYKTSLVHADLNSSNLIFTENRIYLIDWEEAGAGIADLNYIAPLSVHWTDKLIKNHILDKLRSANHAARPLLAYRTLVLFNQKICPSDSRRIRDLELLNYVISS